jgi:hypothetical protein
MCQFTEHFCQVFLSSSKSIEQFLPKEKGIEIWEDLCYSPCRTDFMDKSENGEPCLKLWRFAWYELVRSSETSRSVNNDKITSVP